MKAWKTWLVMGVGLVGGAACTLTVSDGDPDGVDEDDIGLDDQKGFDSDGFDDETDTDEMATDDTGTDDATDEMATDDTGTDVDSGATDDTATDDTVTDEMATDDTTDDMTTDDAPMDDAGTGETCELVPANTCETCMATDCTEAYTACGCDEECAAGLATMLSCYQGKGYNTDNPPIECAEFDDCRAPAVATEGSLLHTLVMCIEADTMMANMEFDRLEGDGTCTKSCTGIFSMTAYLDENGMCDAGELAGDAGAP